MKALRINKIIDISEESLIPISKTIILMIGTINGITLISSSKM